MKVCLALCAVACFAATELQHLTGVLAKLTVLANILPG